MSDSVGWLEQQHDRAVYERGVVAERERVTRIIREQPKAWACEKCGRVWPNTSSTIFPSQTHGASYLGGGRTCDGALRVVRLVPLAAIDLTAPRSSQPVSESVVALRVEDSQPGETRNAQ